MSAAKHTPGPWTTLPEECDRPYIRVRGTALGGRYKIANVLTPEYEGVHHREAEETRANARLIAAAPKLLAACGQASFALRELLPNDPDAQMTVEILRAALTDATGSVA